MPHAGGRVSTGMNFPRVDLRNIPKWSSVCLEERLKFLGFSFQRGFQAEICYGLRSFWDFSVEVLRGDLFFACAANCRVMQLTD